MRICSRRGVNSYLLGHAEVFDQETGERYERVFYVDEERGLVGRFVVDEKGNYVIDRVMNDVVHEILTDRKVRIELGEEGKRLWEEIGETIEARRCSPHHWKQGMPKQSGIYWHVPIGELEVEGWPELVKITDGAAGVAASYFGMEEWDDEKAMEDYLFYGPLTHPLLPRKEEKKKTEVEEKEG